MDVDLGYIAEGLRGLAVPIDSVHGDPANARTGHDVGRIAGSLRQYGQRKPIVVNRLEGGKVEAGNGTLAAARELGWSHIAVVWVEDSPAAAVGFGIADNRTGDLSSWDLATLDELMGSIDLDEVFTGFEAGELGALLEEAGMGGGGGGADVEPKLDRAEELRVKWGVEEVGQLWRLPSRTEGREHRLICGDCTDGGVVERVMGDDMAALVVTDPPYGVSYADKNRFLNAISPANRIEEPIFNDHSSKEETQAMWRLAFERMAGVMRPGAVVYCFMPQGGDQMMMMMMMMMMGAGIEPRHELIWVKNNHVLGRVDYAYKHEPILYAWKPGAGHKFYGGFQTSVLEYAKPQVSDMHPTTKPLALVERLIGNSSAGGEVVYDMFLGSGTTLIAAENLGRVCRGVELSPGYVAVALERYADVFGIEGVLV